LLDYGFNEFKNYQVFKPGDEVERATVWEGQAETVPLIIDESASVTLSFAERKGLKAVVDMPETVRAPIVKGQTIGKLVVSASGIPDRAYPLKAGADVGRLGFFPRIGMAVRYLMSGHSASAKD
jgi:D-alanyl-D-alanine carboxypeptidase (penicillin-binding protein 5/6)